MGNCTMRYVRFLFLAVLFACSPALAQWQTPDNSVPIGRGVGNTGFDYAAPGALGFPLKSNGPSALPSFGPIVNGAITPGAANTVKGSLDGAATTDIPLPSCAADGRHAITYTSGTGWACTATANSFTATIPIKSTVTLTIGSPGIVTWFAGLPADNDVIHFCTTGTLPTGLSPCVPAVGASLSSDTYMSNPPLYYVVPGSQSGGNSFKVSLTRGGAAIDFSGAQAGTHTGFANAYACGGCVGELIYATKVSGSPVNITTSGVGQVWQSITVPPGVWRLYGNTSVIGTSGAVTFTHMHSGIVYNISSTPTAPFNGSMAAHITSNSANGWVFPNTDQPVALYSSTTVNAVVNSDFSGGNAGAYGVTMAERMR